MAIRKVDFLFEMGKWGWSETYFLDTELGGSIDEGVRISTLGVMRAKMVPSPAALRFIRMSDNALYRDAILIRIDDGNVNNPVLPNADVPWNALMCNLVNTSLLKGRKFFRPIPDDYIDFGGVLQPGSLRFTPDEEFVKRFNNFKTELNSFPWVFPARIPVKQTKPTAEVPNPPKIPLNPKLFRKIQDVQTVRILNRQTGRPFDSPVGRRRKKIVA